MTIGWRGYLALLAGSMGLAALLLLGAGPLGWRLGWWHYGYAFQTLLPWAGYSGIIAATVSTVALIASLIGGSGGARALAAGGLVMGLLAIYMPLQASAMRGVHPRTNDISTDLTDPPAFAATLPMRRAEGRSDSAFTTEAADVQRRSYGDVQPLRTSLRPADAFTAASEVAARMPRWRIVATDVGAGRIEASEASRWFGFTDDIVIRVKADGEGSRIDVRSSSRHGRGDFGVNAARVRAYLAALTPRLK